MKTKTEMRFTSRGYVYLAQMNQGIYKIGSTKNLGIRFSDLVYAYRHIGLRCEKFLWSTYSPYYKFWEIDFHRYFYQNRARDFKGHEWFRFDESEIDFITLLPRIIYYKPEPYGIERLQETLSNHMAVMSFARSSMFAE